MSNLFEDLSRSLAAAAPGVGLFVITMIMIFAVCFAFVFLSNGWTSFWKSLDSYPKVSTALIVLMIPLFVIVEAFQILYVVFLVGGFVAVPLGIFSAVFGFSFLKLYCITIVSMLFLLRRELYELAAERYKF